MGATTYAGIDYSHGRSNFNTETGIHFGIIPANDLAHWIYDEFESDYGDPFCPSCSGPVLSSGDDKVPEESADDKDYYCPSCKDSFWSDGCYPDEAIGLNMTGDTYTSFIDDHGDCWVMKSPFYTRAQWCSPCAPGAGYLRNPCPDGPRAYCFDRDMFEDDQAPYPVYSVATGCEVQEPGFFFLFPLGCRTRLQ